MGPTQKVVVMVSGGKDSLCTLDVCIKRFGRENVVGALMYLVKDLDCEWQYVRKLEKRYGIEVVGVPHYELSRLLRDSVYRPVSVANQSIRLLKQSDTENFIREVTGVEWIAWGMRAADSIVRNAYLKRIQGVDQKQRRVYPIWTWKKPDVYGYLHARNLPVPKVTGGTKNFTGGVSLDPSCLVWMKEHFPGDYQKVLKVFPFAGAAVFRHETMGIDPVADAKAQFKARKQHAKEVAKELEARKSSAAAGPALEVPEMHHQTRAS